MINIVLTNRIVNNIRKKEFIIFKVDFEKVSD